MSSNQEQNQRYNVTHDRAQEVTRGQAQEMTREMLSRRTRSMLTLTSRVLREGLPALLTYKVDEYGESEADSEADEEEEPALEDGDKENLNDDEPFEPWDYEWSPWCDDTESISLREYLEEHLYKQKLSPADLSWVNKMLVKNDRQIRIAIQSIEDKQFHSKLTGLVETYDFNYHSVGFADRGIPLPDVRLSRQEKAKGEYKFTVAVMINCDEQKVEKTPANEYLKKSWLALLGDFTWHLVESEELMPFFAADSFEDGWNQIRENLVRRSWSQMKLARKSADDSIKKDEDGKKHDEKKIGRYVNYFRDRISEIKNHRSLEIEFFGVTVPFAQFFLTRGDMR